MTESDTFSFKIVNERLRLVVKYVPWDSHALNVPVVEIVQLNVSDQADVREELSQFQRWLESDGVSMASCRLPHNRIVESMLLEEHGFRFVDMVLHPYKESLSEGIYSDEGLSISLADPQDLEALTEIARSVFTFERFYCDPGLGPVCSGQRYARWVESCLGDSSQRLYKISEQDQIVGFFIVERINADTAHWWLTAIVKRFQGRGYGYRSWRSMLHHQQHQGVDRVTTTISARNTPVLNLYSSLGFRFKDPEMTFHWLRGR